MRVLVQTNDPILLNYAETLLRDAGIEALVFDSHMSMVEGSIGAFPRRLMVPAGLWVAASNVLKDAGLEAWLNDDG